ncbi:Ohr family peroxiredoxin [Virgibacillus sp. MSJ-26]|uniref:Ohr family peroxiredoxin n=1 Tax=Virgibacillus sp. MSJ-26 TaxID=2841522 RepID=UPI001C10C3BD|nr:Ohr family peroxiredoxin [Virgibacillus sp. MSJ-26]MBU5467708.1 Ohr family peroxiredoxin [Virgibacillus sp. MSJ-26]
MSDVIFTSTATAKNGREGHVKSKDGLIDLNLVNPATNKKDKGSNPEQLFAAAYSACFDAAFNLMASKKGKQIESETTAKVNFCKDNDDGGNKLAVDMYIKVQGVSPEEAEELAESAHQVCPYSKATRGNIEVELHPEAIDT